MQTPEEIGLIVARLAIADKTFLCTLLSATEKAGDKMLPEDLPSLIVWAKMMQAIQGSLEQMAREYR